MTERRWLQLAIIVASIVPLVAGGAGMIIGERFLGRSAGFHADVDSHVRYLSGLLFAIGIAYLTCVPRIERMGARVALLSAIVVCGGIARAGGWLTVGPPELPHRLALIMELGVVPLLWMWQRRVAASSAAP